MSLIIALAFIAAPLANTSNSAAKKEAEAPTPAIPLFSPPPGWQAARPKNLSSHVQVGFVGKGSSEFHPSINLATEEIDVSLKEYVQAVKEIHISEPNTTWRDLGKFQMKAGAGRLTEISSTSPWGEVKMLQAIFVKGNRAYILTAAVLKKDFVQLQKEILASLQSLSLEKSLAEPIRDPAVRDRYQKLLSSLGTESKQDKQWEDLQKTIVKDYADLGAHWQFLALQEGYAKIYPAASSGTSQ